jgi:hypothetical protein
MRFWSIAWRIGLLVLIIALPFGVVSALWWPGAVSVAAFGVMAGASSAIAGGFRVGAYTGIAVAAVGVCGILVRDSVWLIAVFMVLLGAVYGLAAARGYAGAAVWLPLLGPYFVASPPALFTQAPPTVTLGYLLAVAGIVAVSGVWAAAVIQLLVTKGETHPGEQIPQRIALSYGLVLGAFAAGCAVAGTLWGSATQWQWVTLTIFLLANPAGQLDREKFVHRVFGTLGGFVLALVLFALTPSNTIVILAALITLWLALTLSAAGKPYWSYVTFLTPSVVLLDSFGYSQTSIADQRLLFTVVGAVLAVAATWVARAWFIPPTPAQIRGPS